jgi:hypothetical protein
MAVTRFRLSGDFAVYAPTAHDALVYVQVMNRLLRYRERLVQEGITAAARNDEIGFVSTVRYRTLQRLDKEYEHRHVYN